MFVFDDQVGGAMPTSSIHLHDDKIRREGLTDLLQEEIHHLSGSDPSKINETIWPRVGATAAYT